MAGFRSLLAKAQDVFINPRWYAEVYKEQFVEVFINIRLGMTPKMAC
jgi:hypothetical protein